MGEAETRTGMTSRPMPSPGINPIRSDLTAIGSYFMIVKKKGNFWAEIDAKSALNVRPGTIRSRRYFRLSRRHELPYLRPLR